MSRKEEPNATVIAHWKHLIAKLTEIYCKDKTILHLWVDMKFEFSVQTGCRSHFVVMPPPSGGTDNALKQKIKKRHSIAFSEPLIYQMVKKSFAQLSVIQLKAENKGFSGKRFEASIEFFNSFIHSFDLRIKLITNLCFNFEYFWDEKQNNNFNESITRMKWIFVNQKPIED